MLIYSKTNLKYFLFLFFLIELILFLYLVILNYSILKIHKQVKSNQIKMRKNEFNNSPPWRGAVLRRGGCPSVFNGYSEKKRKKHI